MIAKEHKHPDGRIVIVVCDSVLVGQKFEEDEKQLDLTSNFYKGTEQDALVIGDMIRNANSIQLVGEESVNLGIQEGIIDKEHIRKIANVPYAHASLDEGQ